jgi:chromosome segregation ATPase
MWHLTDGQFVEELSKRLDLIAADELRTRFAAYSDATQKSEELENELAQLERSFGDLQLRESQLEQQVEDLTADRAVLLIDRRKALNYLYDCRDGLTPAQVTQLLEFLGA